METRYELKITSPTEFRQFVYWAKRNDVTWIDGRRITLDHQYWFVGNICIIRKENDVFRDVITYQSVTQYVEGIKYVKITIEDLFQTDFNQQVARAFQLPAESCWLIEFTDHFNPYRIVIGERRHEEEVARNWGGRRVLYESHWFDIEECLRRNRGVNYTGLYE
jgi:hypothetical protein